MSYIADTLNNLIHQTAFFNIQFGNVIMIVVACVFLYLAIAKQFEPLLLTPIAFGMLLVNIYRADRCGRYTRRFAVLFLFT